MSFFFSSRRRHTRSLCDWSSDVCSSDLDLRTKVLDFGLAGLHSEGAECLTQSHVSMGTANYMAPEQRKDAKRADHRADLYSFGVMAYELLTGELPIGRFPPPSKAVPGLDARWDALVERCLSTEPG